MFKFYFFFLIIFLASCKTFQTHGSGGGGGGAGMPSSAELEDYIKNLKSPPIPGSDEELCQTSENSDRSKTKLVIGKPGTNAWPDTYTKSIQEQFEKNEISKFSIYNITQKEINQSDLNEIGCPNYNNLNNDQKLSFWTIFTSAVAYAESSLKPREVYVEVKGDGTWSSGLCQIDSASGDRWCKNVAIENGISKGPKKQSGKSTTAYFSDEDMLNPDLNLKCCLTMLSIQLDKNKVNGRGTLFPTPAWYWAVLDKRKEARGKVLDWFRVHANIQLPFCKENSLFNSRPISNLSINYNSGAIYDTNNPDPEEREIDPKFGESVKKTECNQISQTSKGLIKVNDQFSIQDENIGDTVGK